MHPLQSLRSLLTLCRSASLVPTWLICHLLTSQVRILVDLRLPPLAYSRMHHEGLIASVTKDGKDSDVKLIEDLLVSYIDKPSCIVLLTVACESMCSHM